MKKLFLAAALLSALTVTAQSNRNEYNRNSNWDNNSYNRNDVAYNEGNRNNGYDNASTFGRMHRYDNPRTRWNDNAGLNISAIKAQTLNRINEGIEHGRINRWEAKRLLSRFENIQNQERAFMRYDGISFDEARILKNDLDLLNLAINQEMNDGFRR